MSVFEQKIAKPAGASGLIAKLADRIARYRVYTTTKAELENLTDRELRDLDISRLEIRSIAYKAAYGG